MKKQPDLHIKFDEDMLRYLLIYRVIKVEQPDGSYWAFELDSEITMDRLIYALKVAKEDKEMSKNQTPSSVMEVIQVLHKYRNELGSYPELLEVFDRIFPTLDKVKPIKNV